MPAILVSILRALFGIAGVAGIGWASSDIFNEYNQRKAQQAEVSLKDSIIASAKTNWIKWVAIIVATLVVSVFIFPLFLNILRVKK